MPFLFCLESGFFRQKCEKEGKKHEKRLFSLKNVL